MKRMKLKKTHPQKYWLKLICKLIYYLGFGQCWYKESPVSKYKKFYRVWAFTSNTYILVFLINELLSFCREDLTTKEMKDLMQLSFAHPTICAKILVLYLRKDRISVVLERLLESNRNVMRSSKLDKQSVKMAMAYCLALASVVYFTVIATIVDAVVTYFKEDVPIKIEVTYYPENYSSGIFINILRFLIDFHWWYIVSVMILIDCLSIFALTFTAFKFRRVRLYFESLRGRFSKKPQRKLNAAVEKQFWQDFAFGITLHEDALWCAKNVQHALGDLYSIQIVESIVLLVICLIKLTMERKMIVVLTNLAFTSSLVVVTGAYMTDAAEITHEASLISTAIFHCGWEFVRPRAGLRTLVVVAVQRSQVPVYMTAFGIITLSYSNFITVLRSSYSFFAVMI